MSRGFRRAAHFIHSALLLLLYSTAFNDLSRLSADSTHPPMPLQINSLHVPTPKSSGDSVLLRCTYELGNETLYAVKWYKNEKEFFRYVPESEPSLKTFPMEGIDVVMSRSDKNSIFLRNLSLDSYGNYTCQVSTDKPFFRCVQTTRHLEVVVPPSDAPVLMEDKSKYEMGDNVSLLCNSGKSRPAADLKMYINDQLAPSELSDQETVVYPDQLSSSSLALHFPLKPEIMHDGKVVVKCVSTVKHIHAVTIKEIRAADGATIETVLITSTREDFSMLFAIVTGSTGGTITSGAKGTESNASLPFTLLTFLMLWMATVH